MLDEIKKVLADKNNIKNIEESTTLSDLGLNVFDAIKLLEDNNIPVVLTQSDKTIINNPKDYSSKSSFICVHKTHFAPTNSRIKSTKEANAMSDAHFEFNEKTYSFKFLLERNTVHVSINSEVGSHTAGDWENCKYAVLVPFENIDNEKIIASLSVDTFTNGGIDLISNCWILCPKGEKNIIKQNNPNVNVIEYEGNKVTGFAQAFVSLLGYHSETALATNWEDIDSEKNFYDFIKSQNIEIASHNQLPVSVEEDQLSIMNAFIAAYDIINKNNLINSPNDIKKITSTYIEGQGIYNQLGSNIWNEYSDLFFDKLNNIGISIPSSYQTIIKSQTKIIEGIKKYKENRYKINFDSIFPEQKNLSFEEKMVISQLKASLKELADMNNSNNYQYEHNLRELFDKFTNICVTSNMNSMLNYKDNSFENIAHSFETFLNSNYFDDFKEEKQVFKNRHTFTDGFDRLSKETSSTDETSTYFLSIGNYLKVKYIPSRPSDIPFKGVNGKLVFSYEDENGHVYHFKFDELSDSNPTIVKDRNIIELGKGQSIFDIIPNSNRKESFKKDYNKLKSYDMYNMLENCLCPNKEKTNEIHNATFQIGKRTINCNSLDKKQIDATFEQWYTREENREKNVK